MNRVAVVGASGLVGAALIEELIASRIDVVPLVHSTGNAWQLARHGLRLHQVDLLAPDSLHAALDGVDTVVNCSRGDDAVMLQGLRVLLKACRARGVRRFVHLSSVAVYGDPPPPDSATESGPTRPERDSYGWLKLQQDRIVERAASAGFATIILCPPNIIGPGSHFLVQLVGELRKGTLALVDGGEAPCNTVDVANLVHAIRLAMASPIGDGRRLFVLDSEALPWRSLLESLAESSGLEGALPELSSAALRARLDALKPPRPKLRNAFKHLISSDVRNAMRRDPILARMDDAARSFVTFFGSGVESRLRRSLNAGGLRPADPLAAVNVKLCAQQLRSVRHSPARAHSELGYAPPYSVRDSLAAFRLWLRTRRGMDTAEWQLARFLY